MMEFLGQTPLTKPLIFDSHAHYDDPCFAEDRNLLFNALSHNGIAGIITCGCDPESSRTAMHLAEQNGAVYFSAGIHPGSAEYVEKNGLSNCLNEIKTLLSHKKCVAIGEIGLDYYWVKENAPLQKQIFSGQLALSKESGLPVIVHDRDAHADTLELLKQYTPNGVVHSFSGSPEMAQELFGLGMYIGISGVLTFKNARRLPQVVAEMPLDRFLLETDAPYLAPVPFRGKTNHSAMIYFSALKIAEIRGISVEKVLEHALENTKKLYQI